MRNQWSQWAIRQVWVGDVRLRGLRIMTVGFLIAVLGACVAMGGAFVRDQLSGYVLVWGLQVVVWVGFFVLVIGAVGMLAGIVLNIVTALTPRE